MTENVSHTETFISELTAQRPVQADPTMLVQHHATIFQIVFCAASFANTLTHQVSTGINLIGLSKHLKNK